MAQTTTEKFYADMERRFAGRLHCVCGNNDWKQFIYVAVGDDVMVGCKKCGTVVTKRTESNEQLSTRSD